MSDPRKSAFTVTVVNHKGGVGKSSLAANIGAICADLGQRVLLIDCDQQGSLSQWFPVTVPAQRGLSHVLRARAIDASCISQTDIDGLSIILRDAGMGAALVELAAGWRSDAALDQAIRGLRDGDLFDIVIIDTPGTIATSDRLLLDLAIVPADLLLAPIVPESLSTAQVDTLLELLQRYERDAPDSRQAATPCKAIINKYTTTSNSRELTAELRRKFMPSRGRFTLAKTLIPQSAMHDQAVKKKTAVHRIEPQRGGQLGPASTALHALVAELFPHLYDAVHSPDDPQSDGAETTISLISQTGASS